MKFSDKIAAYEGHHPFFTFEFFPPRTDEGFANLLTRISRLSLLNPLAISVTWGAGGSTRDRTLDLAGMTHTERGLTTIMHLTCTNMEKGTVDATLRDAKLRGIQNILALRGDPPRGEEYWIPTDPRFQHASDLVAYIKGSPEFSSYFCVGVAAYPDGHTDRTVDEDGEIDNLKIKTDAGADFIFTQLFYDVEGFISWLKKVREKGITIPIIPGIMPLQSYASFLRLTKLCGTRIPTDLHLSLERIRHDDQKVKDFGIELAIKMIQRLTKESDIRGVHFCTLNLERSVRKVLEGLGWTSGGLESKNKLIVDVSDNAIQSAPPKANLLITPTDATSSATNNMLTVRQVQELQKPGKGEINHASTWDEFPNGRFGDPKSPAFGTQDPWNAGLSMSRAEVLYRWGSPKSMLDLTNIFLSHLQSKIVKTPFSPGPLSAESKLILPYLQKLTEKGWWTVTSQPATDGVSSSDEVFGWGPEGGYVYQKGFVEFFADESDIIKLVKRVQSKGEGSVDFMASNVKSDFRSNMNADTRNAVTWGVFPEKEIVQEAIIERDSFMSWKEEVFSIWKLWSSYFAPGSEERQLLDSVQHEKWLICIIHHDYKDPNKLWKFIFDEYDE